MKFAWGAAALAVGCMWVAIAAAQAQPIAPMPPSEVYVPGNAQAFQAGVDAFDAKDYAKAYAIFSELAAHDDLAALRNVALMQRKGLGTAKDPKAAIANYTKAAEAGLPTAAADLGEMLLEGEAGPPDPKAALPWLVLAAGASHPIAQYLLGEMYERGYGVPQDLSRAEELYAAAAAHGLAAATTRLDAVKGWKPAPAATPEDAAAKPGAAPTEPEAAH